MRCRCPTAKPTRSPAKAARFGEGLDNQQVWMVLDQRDRAFRTKIDICLVDDNDLLGMIGKQPLDLRELQRYPSGRIRIGQDDRAAGLPIVGNADLHGVIQRHLTKIDAIEAAIGRVEAVADVRKEQRVIVFQQCLERVGQDFVGAVAHEDIARVETVALRRSPPQPARSWIGIEPQCIRRLRRDCRQRARRRPVRIFRWCSVSPRLAMPTALPRRKG